MIIDADPSGNTCHKALFNIGGTTTTSRSWDVRITQYACGDTDSSGYDSLFTILQAKFFFCMIEYYVLKTKNLSCLSIKLSLCLTNNKSAKFSSAKAPSHPENLDSKWLEMN